MLNIFISKTFVETAPSDRKCLSTAGLASKCEVCGDAAKNIGRVGYRAVVQKLYWTERVELSPISNPEECHAHVKQTSWRSGIDRALIKSSFTRPRVEENECQIIPQWTSNIQAPKKSVFSLMLNYCSHICLLSIGESFTFHFHLQRIAVTISCSTLLS